MTATMSWAEAILKVLDGRAHMALPEIYNGVRELMGEPNNNFKATVRQSLQAMAKKGQTRMVGAGLWGVPQPGEVLKLPTKRRQQFAKPRKKPADVVKLHEPSVLERVAAAHQLPAGSFAHRKETEAYRQVTLYMLKDVHERAQRTAKAMGHDGITEVVAETIATYAQPPREQVRNLSDTLTPVKDLGLGSGIDYDGEFRHVRMPNIEGRREEWLGNKFADLVTAMRKFVDAVPPGVKAEYARKWLSVDPKNTAGRQAKLDKAKLAFVPLAQEVLAMLKELELEACLDTPQQREKIEC